MKAGSPNGAASISLLPLPVGSAPSSPGRFGDSWVHLRQGRHGASGEPLSQLERACSVACGSPERKAALSGLCCLLALYWLFPSPSTLHVYLAAIVAIATWLLAEAAILAWAWRKRKPTAPHWSARKKLLACVAAGLCLLLFFQGSRLPAEPALPALPASSTPLLIVTTVHDSARIWPHLTEQLSQFIEHVGHSNVHLSLLESSRSGDSTYQLLTDYDQTLRVLHISHTVAHHNASDEDGYWVDVHSRDHVNRHAFARNKALEPLEQGLNGQPFSKSVCDATDTTRTLTEQGTVLFADAVWFHWTDLVRLLSTASGRFDMACGTEWGSKGLSDAWTFRDRCGIRARPAYPHLVHDEAALDSESTFEVASCWNSLAALEASPFLLGNAEHLRNAMINERKDQVLNGDGRVNTLIPAVPLVFHATPVEECSASEGMLLAYDLHLLYRPSRPRIFVNPQIKVSQKRNWYILYKRILRRPFVRPWVYLWDRYLGPIVLSAARELGRPAEQCQWQGFMLADGCPPPANGALGLVT